MGDPKPIEDDGLPFSINKDNLKKGFFEIDANDKELPLGNLDEAVKSGARVTRNEDGSLKVVMPK